MIDEEHSPLVCALLTSSQERWMAFEHLFVELIGLCSLMIIYHHSTLKRLKNKKMVDMWKAAVRLDAEDNQTDSNTKHTKVLNSICRTDSCSLPTQLFNPFFTSGSLRGTRAKTTANFPAQWRTCSQSNLHQHYYKYLCQHCYEDSDARVQSYLYPQTMSINMPLMRPVYGWKCQPLTYSGPVTFQGGEFFVDSHVPDLHVPLVSANCNLATLLAHRITTSSQLIPLSRHLLVLCLLGWLSILHQSQTHYSTTLPLHFTLKSNSLQHCRSILHQSQTHYNTIGLTNWFWQLGVQCKHWKRLSSDTAWS